MLFARCLTLSATILMPVLIYPLDLASQSEQLQAAVSKGHRLGSEENGVAAVNELLDRGHNVNA